SESKLGGPDQVARLDVNTRSDDSTVSIVAADTAHAGDDIVVKVRVKNPTKLAIAQVEVGLATKADELAGTFQGIAEDAVQIDETPGATIALAPHQSRDVVFHVHTKATGTLGLFATARCSGDDCYGDSKGGPPRTEVDDAALDAIDILPA